MQADKLRELQKEMRDRAVSCIDTADSAAMHRFANRLDELLLAIAEGAEADRVDARRWRSMRDRAFKSNGDICFILPRAYDEFGMDSASIDMAADAALAGAVTQGEGHHA